MALKEKEALTNRKTTTCKNVSVTKESKRGEHGERQIIYDPLVTVDQLSAYRKRKPALAPPTDSIFLPEGSLKHLTSEYQRCFRKFEPILAPISCKGEKRNTLMKLEGEHAFQSEYERAYIQSTESFYRPQLIRNSTNLKLEGEFYHVTDYRENFTAFLLQKKLKVQRRASTLQMLGQMNLETENRRNYVLYQNVLRPPLCKKLTNLHLSGSLHLDTENRDKFLRYKVEKPHLFMKMPTNLHLEGPFFLQPEYTSAFVEYKNYERQKPALPVDKIKSPVDFIVSSENITHHPLIPHLRSYLYSSSDNATRSSLKSNSRPPSRNSERFLDVELGNHPRKEVRDYGAPAPIIIRTSEPKINVSKSEGNFSKWSTNSRTNTGNPKPSSPGYFSKEENADSIAKSLPRLRRSNWKSKSNIDCPELLRSKPTLPGYHGRLECAPEYRKAYLNYITRERIYEQQQQSAPRWKNMSNIEAMLQGLPPTHKQQIRSRKSSPNLSAHAQKSLDLIETAAFGRGCRNTSMSEISSADDIMSTAKKSQIPRWSKMPTRTKNYQDRQEDTESEPAFIVM